MNHLFAGTISVWKMRQGTPGAGYTRPATTHYGHVSKPTDRKKIRIAHSLMIICTLQCALCVRESQIHDIGMKFGEGIRIHQPIVTTKVDAPTFGPTHSRIATAHSPKARCARHRCELRSLDLPSRTGQLSFPGISISRQRLKEQVGSATTIPREATPQTMTTTPLHRYRGLRPPAPITMIRIAGCQGAKCRHRHGLRCISRQMLLA